MSKKIKKTSGCQRGCGRGSYVYKYVTIIYTAYNRRTEKFPISRRAYVQGRLKNFEALDAPTTRTERYFMKIGIYAYRVVLDEKKSRLIKLYKLFFSFHIKHKLI